MTRNNSIGAFNRNIIQNIRERRERLRLPTRAEEVPDALQRFILDTLEELGVINPLQLFMPLRGNRTFRREALIEITTGNSKSLNFEAPDEKMLVIKSIEINPEDKFTFDNLQIEFLLCTKKRILNFSGVAGITEGFTNHDNILLVDDLSD